jgi:CheY-like chemotaxis protein
LIVEDESISTEDLEEVLKDLGYQVSAEVSSGEEALREAERNRPDLVLMDIRIKGEMDGTEAARLLRDRFDVPVVYLTAHADRDTFDRAKRSRPILQQVTRAKAGGDRSYYGGSRFDVLEP